MKMTKQRTAALVLLVLLAGTMTLFAAAQQEQQALARKLIRLHVVANSDSERDQSVKLQVRDAVLAVTEPLLEDAENPEAVLLQALPRIRQAAQMRLRELGSDDLVRVTLTPERFPTRYYDSFALPAGVYLSLRVTIGAGEGQNWWCVAYPSICLRAAADLEEAAAAAGFSDREIRFMTGAQEDYVLKFRILELLGELKARLYG